jgi:3-oxoacyl-[acyl-carrier-protein] synthase-3
MNQNIIIGSIGTYTPANQISNSFYINHFKNLGIDVSGLLKHLSSETRYIADHNTENVITMAYEAAIKALKSANLDPTEIDLLVFCTDTPEQLTPTNALLLHDKLHTTNADQIFDLNSNCIGMLSGLDVASRILSSNSRINKALVVGSFMGSLIASKYDPVCYSTFGDAAVAVILYKTEESYKRGFIDANFKTNTIIKDFYRFPSCGFSQIYNPNIDIEDKKLKSNSFDMSIICKDWIDLMSSLCTRYDVDKHSIKQFFFSQFSKPDTQNTLEMMGVELNKYTFIGNKYGYTGLTGPLLAYNEALHNKSIQSGDYIMFCSMGAGYNLCAILYKL